MNDAGTLRTGDIGTVEDRFFRLRDFPVADGTVMPEATIAYETYGQLNADRSNAILICHALSGHAHAAGFNSPDELLAIQDYVRRKKAQP